MARHYSTRDFFRQIPNALLARYFAGRGLFGDLDFTAMKETKPNALFDGWLALPEEQRKPMDAEFQDIFELSCEKGFRAIIDEARWQMQADSEGLTAFIETLSALLTRYFEAREVDLGVVFGDLSETQVEPLFEAFTTLPEEQPPHPSVPCAAAISFWITCTS